MTERVVILNVSAVILNEVKNPPRVAGKWRETSRETLRMAQGDKECPECQENARGRQRVLRVTKGSQGDKRGCHSERLCCHSERSEGEESPSVTESAQNDRSWVIMNKQYYVYIITNVINTVLYTGVTNNLLRRVMEHKEGVVEGFSKRYNLCKLVYYEVTESIESAISREKQIKGWLRKKKIALIESSNPDWRDISNDLCD